MKSPDRFYTHQTLKQITALFGKQPYHFLSAQSDILVSFFRNLISKIKLNLTKNKLNASQNLTFKRYIYFPAEMSILKEIFLKRSEIGSKSPANGEGQKKRRPEQEAKIIRRQKRALAFNLLLTRMGIGFGPKNDDIAYIRDWTA